MKDIDYKSLEEIINHILTFSIIMIFALTSYIVYVLFITFKMPNKKKKAKQREELNKYTKEELISAISRSSCEKNILNELPSVRLDLSSVKAAFLNEKRD